VPKNLTLNYDSAWIHLSAIREAIARRGGPEQLAFDGWLATVTDRQVVVLVFLELIELT